jgi:Family of unknown function (DUF6518)
VHAHGRLARILLAAVAFGVLVAVVKGQHDDARNVVGNTSAPWMVVPFVAGMAYRRAWHGALVGVAATAVAFAGFYVAEAVILDLGPHPWYVDLRLAAGTVNVYEKLGVLSGAAYGALGVIWAVRRSLPAALALALAFVLEPALVLALARGGIWGGGSLVDHPGVWLGEVAVGLALALGFWRARRSISPSATTAESP